MLPATIETYGGPYVDAEVVENPETDFAAAKANRALEDTAQLTRTGYRALVSFTPTASAAPAAATVTMHTSVWGSGEAQKPVVEKTATGRYTIRYALAYDDGLEVEEDVSFLAAHCSYLGTTYAPSPQLRTIAANVITIGVLDSTFAESDLAGAGTVTVWIR